MFPPLIVKSTSSFSDWSEFDPDQTTFSVIVLFIAFAVVEYEIVPAVSVAVAPVIVIPALALSVPLTFTVPSATV